MFFENGLDDGKSQPRALDGAFMRLRRAIVSFPDGGDLLRFDPLARIGDGEADDAVRLSFQRNFDELIFARIIDRVADEIIQHLADFDRICLRIQVLFDLRFETIAVPFRKIFEFFQHPERIFRQIEHLRL